MTKEEKKAADSAAVVAAVTEHYIYTGKDLSIKEIAELSFFSESKIRTLFAAAGGVLLGLSVSKGERLSGGNFSGSYRAVWVYEPSGRHLAEIIRELRVKE
jgi:hypothetical protein